jgi:replication factor C large subunit
MSIPWTEKYRPRLVREIVGNRQAIQQFLEWIRGWEKGGPASKAVILAGPPGVGKTSLVLAYAHEYSWDLVEINASDERSGERLRELLGASVSQATLTGTRKRIILVDEVDGIAGKEASGGVAVLTSLIKASRVPMVLVANDPWDARLAPLRQIAPIIKFNRVRREEIFRHLKMISDRERIGSDEKVLREIADRAEGDLRGAINDLQLLASAMENPALLLPYLGERDREKTSFDVLAGVFGAKTASDGRLLTMNTDMDMDQVITWVYDNLFKQFQKPEALAEAMKIVAEADLHLARMKRFQMWGLTRYVAPLVGAGPGIIKSLRGEKGGGFEFPSKIRFMQQTRDLRGRVAEALSKIASKSRMSRSKAATEMLPYVAEMIRGGDRGVAAHYGLSQEEVQAIETVFKTVATMPKTPHATARGGKSAATPPRGRTRARRRSP